MRQKSAHLLEANQKDLSQNQVNYKKIKPLLGKSKRILFEKYGKMLMLQFI
jgi:hypothetical protein